MGPPWRLTFSIMTLGITTLSITTFSVIIHGIKTLIVSKLNSVIDR